MHMNKKIKLFSYAKLIITKIVIVFQNFCHLLVHLMILKNFTQKEIIYASWYKFFFSIFSVGHTIDEMKANQLNLLHKKQEKKNAEFEMKDEKYNTSNIQNYK